MFIINFGNIKKTFFSDCLLGFQYQGNSKIKSRRKFVSTLVQPNLGFRLDLENSRKLKKISSVIWEAFEQL